LRSQADALLGVGPVGRNLRRVPDVRRRFLGNVTAMLRYRPGPLGGPTVVFKTDLRDSLRTRLAGTRLGRVTIHPAGGDHWSMLADPHVHDLATRLRAVLPARATVHTGDKYGH
jgi:phthiocerol/phenolphthiocerol synthesis type-I polyketide synthase E